MDWYQKQSANAMIDWEKLPNGKWRKKNDGLEKSMNKMKKKKLFCNDCNAFYLLTNPCIHHLTDSPEDSARFEAHKRAMKKKRNPEPEEVNKQQRLYDG